MKKAYNLNREYDLKGDKNGVLGVREYTAAPQGMYKNGYPGRRFQNIGFETASV
jgi:hypothetical protein